MPFTVLQCVNRDIMKIKKNNLFIYIGNGNVHLEMSLIKVLNLTSLYSSFHQS